MKHPEMIYLPQVKLFQMCFICMHSYKFWNGSNYGTHHLWLMIMVQPRYSVIYFNTIFIHQSSKQTKFNSASKDILITTYRALTYKNNYARLGDIKHCNQSKIDSWQMISRIANILINADYNDIGDIVSRMIR